MPTDTIRTAIGAAATLPNILAGRAFEFFGEAGVLTIYGNGDIAGMSLSLTAFRGSRVGEAHIPAGSGLGIASTAGKIKTNEDFIGQYAIPAGSRLILSVTNPGAASNITFQLNT